MKKEKRVDVCTEWTTQHKPDLNCPVLNPPNTHWLVQSCVSHKLRTHYSVHNAF